MSDLTLGALYGAVTLVVMFSGMPIAFALGVVATGFMYFFMPASSLDTVTQNVYEEMASITLLSIPLFILKGAAIGHGGLRVMRLPYPTGASPPGRSESLRVPPSGASERARAAFAPSAGRCASRRRSGSSRSSAPSRRRGSKT